jgi:hypothetical protein
MDPVGGPDTKKARWSPTSFVASAAAAGANGAQNPNGSSSRDVFANYGYGPQAAISQAQFGNSPTSASVGGFGGNNPLYSTPSLSISTAATNGNGMAMHSQLSPSNVTAFQQQQHHHHQQQQQQQQQQQHQQQQQATANGNAYGGFGGYNMLGMGMPGMNMNMLGGFPYANQMGSFGQVGPVQMHSDFYD